MEPWKHIKTSSYHMHAPTKGFTGLEIALAWLKGRIRMTEHGPVDETGVERLEANDREEWGGWLDRLEVRCEKAREEQSAHWQQGCGGSTGAVLCSWGCWTAMVLAILVLFGRMRGTEARLLLYVAYGSKPLRFSHLFVHRSMMFEVLIPTKKG